jgi:predicted nucleotidyltransferase
MADNGFAAQLAQDLDAGDLRTVLAVFRQDVDRLTGMLDSNLAAGDIVAFRRTCHALAGAAGAVGAAALEQACRLGMMRADLGPAQLPALHGAIRACSAAALDEATAFLATLPPK